MKLTDHLLEQSIGVLAMLRDELPDKKEKENIGEMLKALKHLRIIRQGNDRRLQK